MSDSLHGYMGRGRPQLCVLAPLRFNANFTKRIHALGAWKGRRGEREKGGKGREIVVAREFTKRTHLSKDRRFQNFRSQIGARSQRRFLLNEAIPLFVSLVSLWFTRRICETNPPRKSETRNSGTGWQTSSGILPNEPIGEVK
jgi:hypothetical protein